LRGSLSLFLIFDDLSPYWGKIWVITVLVAGAEGEESGSNLSEKGAGITVLTSALPKEGTSEAAATAGPITNLVATKMTPDPTATQAASDVWATPSFGLVLLAATSS
jgi:hypothetical protein